MPVAASLVDLLHDAQWDPTSDRLLDYFLKYTTARQLSLYPAQEEAVLMMILCDEDMCKERKKF